MNLFFRFLLLLIKRFIKLNAIDLFDPCVTPFRVNILDLDLNLHMNNGRYFSVMDLGRFDLMLRSKTFWLLMKKGYLPVVSSQAIRFKKSLNPFQKFDLITHIEAWDEKDFYINQRFVVGEEIYAEAIVKGRFLKKGQGSIPTEQVFKETGKEYILSEPSERMDLVKKIDKSLSNSNI